MTAKLITHRRQKLIREIVITARTESLIKRRSQHRSRNSLIDPGLDRPAPFTGVRNSPSNLRHLRILEQRTRSKFHHPTTNHPPTPPHLTPTPPLPLVL